MSTAREAGQPRSHDRGGARRLGIDVLFATLMVGYGVLYLGWQVFRWGGPDLELVIGDAAYIPLAVLVVAFSLRAARHAPTRPSRRAWLVIALAFASYAFGDVAWFFLEAILGVSPFPSIADVGYLGFYPLLLVGVLTFRRERPEDPRRTASDLAIVLVAAGTLIWWLVLEPVATAGSGFEALISLAYPIGDLLLLSALAAALMNRLVGISRSALALLTIGLTLNVIADLAFARLSLEDAYGTGVGWVDASWLAGWVSMGLAGFVQARSMFPDRNAGAAVEPTRPVSFLPYVALAGVYGLLIFATEVQGPSLRVVVVGAMAVSALVLMRQVLTSRENTRLLTDRVRIAARFQAIIQNTENVIAVVDPEGIISYVTPSVMRLVGRPAECFAGVGVDTLLEPQSRTLVLALLQAAAARPGTGDSIQAQVRDSTGAAHQVEIKVTNLIDEPAVGGIVVTMRDVTERRDLEELLRDRALHDPLTGLANRVLIADRIGHALRRRQPLDGATPTLLYLDLDDFKGINDSLGHGVGDQVLVEVGRRLSRAIRAEDTVARLGGDEFAILLDQTRSVEEVVMVANRILADLRMPIDVDGTRVAIGASIGIARPEPGADAEDVLREADIAMYAAKRDAPGTSRLFEKAMLAATVERASLEADLRLALAAGQFEIVYEPLFDLSDDRLTGVEALLRWNHPTRGLLMPLQFIPLAEDTGEIIQIGLWVIEQTCVAVGGWSGIAGTHQLHASVNVAARQLEPRLVEDVAGILRRTGFAAERLVLEVTESVIAAERPGVLEVLAALRASGVRISIDDFGTGYLPLSVLRQLPIDEIKIDRSFISALRDQGDTSIIKAIIKLSHDYNVATVAEGIEGVASEGQVALLRTLGCDIGQGFLLGRPGPATAIEDRLRRDLDPSAAGVVPGA